MKNEVKNELYIDTLSGEELDKTTMIFKHPNQSIEYKNVYLTQIIYCLTNTKIKHRLDGPAVTYSDGNVAYAIDGKIFENNEDFYKHPTYLRYIRNEKLKNI